MLASSQAPPRFYLAAVEKNREKARDQNYVTTGNGGLGWFVMMATCPRTMWPVLASSIRLDVFGNSYGLRRYQVTNKRCVGISGRRFACTLTER